jgi:hypothetical protein
MSGTIQYMYSTVCTVSYWYKTENRGTQAGLDRETCQGSLNKSVTTSSEASPPIGFPNSLALLDCFGLDKRHDRGNAPTHLCHVPLHFREGDVGRRPMLSPDFHSDTEYQQYGIDGVTPPARVHIRAHAPCPCNASHPSSRAPDGRTLSIRSLL